MDELFDQGDALDLAAAVRKREVSAKEVLAHALARLEERNGRLNAVAESCGARAMAAVEAGLPDALLRGVPFVIKDLKTDVAGMANTNGSRLFANRIATADAEIVARYRRAGLVVIGTTNTPEFGLNGSTEPVLRGPTRNPHRLTRSPGGSSGGSAAAVAGGIVPAGHATDGGGSIRIPASACGLFGLKPTRGRTPGAPLAAPLSVHHAVTRSVRDSAALLDAVTGWSGDAGIRPAPSGSFLDEVGAAPPVCRIGLTTVRPDGQPADPACAAAAEDAARLLEQLGHRVEVAAPDFPVEAIRAVGAVFMAAPLVVDVDDRLEELGRDLRDDDLEPFTHVMYDLGRQLTASKLVRALRELEHVGATLGAFFREHDLLLTPTLAEPVPPLGLLDTTDPASMYRHGATFSAFTSFANASGQPAMSLPLGADPDGLPVGVQVVAAHGREDLLLRLAAQIEHASPWSTRPVWPPVE